MSQEAPVDFAPKKQLPVSASTLAVMAEIKRAKNAGRKQHLSPIPHLLQQRESHEVQVQVTDMRQKHQELLKAKPELVLPLKYKQLADQMDRLDQALVFLKQVRKVERPLLDDVIQSVKASFGRDMSAIILRQILAVVPEFYN